MMAVECWINCLDCEFNRNIAYGDGDFRILTLVAKHIEETKHTVQVVAQYKEAK